MSAQQDTHPSVSSSPALPRCLYCGLPIADAKPRQLYCKPGHKAKAYGARLSALPDAIDDVLIDLVMRGAIPDWRYLPPKDAIALAVDTSKACRDRLIELFDLRWDAGERNWIR